MSKGIRIHYTSNFDFNSKNKLVYKKEELYKITEMISSREVLLGMVESQEVREGLRAEFAGTTEETAISGEAYWPLSDWHKIFAEIARNGETEEVHIVFDESTPREQAFKVIKVPRGKQLTQRQRKIIAEYITAYIYNRLGAIGDR